MHNKKQVWQTPHILDLGSLPEALGHCTGGSTQVTQVSGAVWCVNGLDTGATGSMEHCLNGTVTGSTGCSTGHNTI